MKKTIRSEVEKKQLRNRLNRISGQIDGVKRMIEDDRSVVLEKHMYSCIKTEVAHGNSEVVDEIMDLFRRF